MLVQDICAGLLTRWGSTFSIPSSQGLRDGNKQLAHNKVWRGFSSLFHCSFEMFLPAPRQEGSWSQEKGNRAPRSMPEGDMDLWVAGEPPSSGLFSMCM